MLLFAEWLREAGLGRYESVFAENDIDFSVVRKLTESDLKELGLTLGHRKKFLDALAALDSHEPALAQSPVQSPSPAASFPTGGERRQLTVMFCDLVGSTALSERLDPEELRALLHAYRMKCGEVIAQYEGHVARYVGDGILTYFGWPKAHEEDAERAVRAALEIVQAVKTVSAPEVLSVRVGIATGPVVVGEQAGEGAESKLAVGSTPNLAARLQGLAGPDQIVIAPATRRLIGAAFELLDLGAHLLKGITEPVHAWRVAARAKTESRFDAARQGAPAPMVGRDAELAAAIGAWDKARSGIGQVVLLCGEPGIGKSRLLKALRERTAPDDAHVWTYQCSPYSVNTSLHPVIDHFERALSAERDEAPEGRLERLERLMRDYGRPPTDVNLVARLLSLPAEERYGALGMSPQKQKEETLRALNDIAEVAARQRPLLMLFEDLHWADPTTLDLLDKLLARGERMALLLFATHRPEFRSRWIEHSSVTMLTMRRLDAKQTAAVAERVAAKRRLPEVIVQHIVSKTDGVPLFVEELTKVILESGLLVDRGDAYALSGSLSALSIPSTLRDSLMSRLDRLGTVKEIAQIGACIGREFGYQLLSLISPLDDGQLVRALEQLVASELVFRLDGARDPRFMFKHALVQDTAYDSLLKSRRAQIHALIAMALESHFPATARSEPEVLARHFSSAGMPEQAIPYWLAAGRQATGRSANSEAINHLTKGVELVATQPASQQRDRLELDFRVSLTTPIIATHGWGAPEFEAAYRRAVDLCDRVEDVELVSRALYMQWGYGTWTARHRIAEQAATRLLAMADARGERVAQLMGHGLLGRVQCYMGDILEGRRNIEQSLALADPEQDRDLALRYGQDPVVAGLAGLSWCLWLLGHPGAGRHARDQAIERAELIKHPQTLAYSLAVGLWIGMLERDARSLEVQACRFDTLIDEQGFKHWYGFATIARSILISERGDKRGAIEAAREARAALAASSCMIFAPLIASFQGRMLLEDGATAEALHEVEAGLAISRRTAESFADAELQRLHGEISLARGDRYEAIQCFEASLATARAQGARMLELRTATYYARLLVNQQREEQALQLLEPIFASFSGELETPDIAQAKSLMQELS